MALLGMTTHEDAELSQLKAQDGALIKTITLKASCGDLARGTVLEMTSIAAGTWQQLAVDGGANARAILAQDVVDDVAEQTALAYFVGMYRFSDLVFPEAITPTQLLTALVGLADRGILVDAELVSLL